MPGLPGDLAAAKNALSASLLAPPDKGEFTASFLHAFRATGGLGPAARGSMPPLVHAVGVGRKRVQGAVTETMAVRVYVTRKSPGGQLPLSERVPPSINGIPTDVIEAPPADFLAAASPCSATRQASNRPILGGISTGHYAGETGTVGYFCRSTHPADSSSDVFVLSNAHIYSKYSAAHVGDNLLQPGVLDGGTSAARIAGFVRDVPLVFGGARNDVDAAIGKLDPGVGYNLQVCSIGKIAGTAAAEEDDVVAKHGRTSGYTEGIVDDELIDFIMAPSHSTSFIQFRDQMRIVPRSPAYMQVALGGDSGSLVVKTDSLAAVGLLHATAIDGSYAYANHIAKVLSLLQIALL